MADLATMADHTNVQTVDPVGWGNLRKHGVGLVGVDFGTDQAQAFTHSMHMGVYRHLQLGVLHIASRISSMLSRGWLRWIYSFAG